MEAIHTISSHMAGYLPEHADELIGTHYEAAEAFVATIQNDWEQFVGDLEESEWTDQHYADEETVDSVSLIEVSAHLEGGFPYAVSLSSPNNGYGCIWEVSAQEQS